MLAAIQAVRPHLLAGCSRQDLVRFMRPGPARNAVDCALWDLEAKLTGRRVEDISGTGTMKPVTTVYTLSLLSPRDMEEEAAREAHRPALKVKLGHFADDRARLRGVRRAAPEARLIVDANEGWSFEQTVEMSKVAADCGVVLIEQPVPAGSDGVLKDWRSPVPLCADESCHTRADVDRVADRGYDAITSSSTNREGLRKPSRSPKRRGRAASADGRLHERHDAGDGAGVRPCAALPGDRSRFASLPAARRRPANRLRSVDPFLGAGTALGRILGGRAEKQAIRNHHGQA